MKTLIDIVSGYSLEPTKPYKRKGKLFVAKVLTDDQLFRRIEILIEELVSREMEIPAKTIEKWERKEISDTAFIKYLENRLSQKPKDHHLSALSKKVRENKDQVDILTDIVITLKRNLKIHKREKLNEWLSGMSINPKVYLDATFELQRVYNEGKAMLDRSKTSLLKLEASIVEYKQNNYHALRKHS